MWCAGEVAGRANKERKFALALLACLLAVAGGAAAEPGERKPNAFERAYIAIALDIESHEPCRKISPRAIVRAPFNSPGTRVYFARSRCFFVVAHQTLNPYICRWVVPASDSASKGGYFTRANCQALVAKGRAYNVHLSFDHGLVLKALGYTDEDVKRRFPRHPEEDSWMFFYHDFFRRADGSLQRRLKNLPDFSRR